MSSLQEIAGIRQMLDRLEQRTIAFREVLLNMSLGNSAGEGAEKKAIKNAEVEPIENVIVDLANRLTGGDPQPGMWERSHPYCSRNEAKGKSSWGAQNYEYFQWFLYWIEMSRTYLEFLAGYQSASGEPRSSSAVASAPMPGSPRVSSDRRPYDVAL